MWRMERPDPESAVFAALADPARRAILGWLREEPRAVGELVDRLPLTQPAVTKHLGVLERAGLIRRRPEGRRRICELSQDGFRVADRWLGGYRPFWEGALDRLAALAEADRGGGDHD